ncbi:YceI family protein [Mesonia ostreae]|uniref:YceI family protein n=1 Tax=Mesonia ostreae TaxID=861110 RepID=A0ABU2KED7_9FLAO|nr:YceI family protein [Mesonia ostreae]MDT0293057.1 YceI family protein [Mesonia ostreae]
MKKVFLNAMLVAFIGITSVSCKNEPKNETKANEAEEVAVAADDAQVFMIDANNSKIEWKGAKPGGEHTGTIAVKDGKFSTMGEKLESGSIVIDMESITVTDLEGQDKMDLEGHLKGTAEGKEDHFFNVAEHPVAKFEITNLMEKDGKTWLSGNLVMKGNSKNVDIPVNYSMKDDGEKLMIESEPFTIDRTQWKVNYGSKSVFDDLKEKYINDKIEIKFMVEAKKA